MALGVTKDNDKEVAIRIRWRHCAEHNQLAQSAGMQGFEAFTGQLFTYLPQENLKDV